MSEDCDYVDARSGTATDEEEEEDDAAYQMLGITRIDSSSRIRKLRLDFL